MDPTKFTNYFKSAPTPTGESACGIWHLEITSKSKYPVGIFYLDDLDEPVSFPIFCTNCCFEQASIRDLMFLCITSTTGVVQSFEN